MEVKTDAELRNKILDVLESSDEALSATGVASELGYSKGNVRVTRILDELVESEEVCVDKSGSYPLFSIPETAGSTEDEKGPGERYENYKGDDPLVNPTQFDEISDEFEDPEGDERGEPVDPSTVKEITYVLPTDLRGYEVTEGKNGLVIKDPSGVEFETPSNEHSLIIINERPFGYVKDCAGVVRAIKQYTEEKGIGAYTISDLNTGEFINDESDVNPAPVLIFLEISRYNKAG